jgi:hypothetical protein
MSHYRSSYRFLVAAQADSTFLCRVCGLLASLSVVPHSFCSTRHGDDAGETTLVMELVDVTAKQVDLLERKLSQITLVAAVESVEEIREVR